MVNYILSKSPNGLFLIFERSVQFDFTIRPFNSLSAKGNFFIPTLSESLEQFNKKILSNSNFSPLLSNKHFQL